MRGGDLLFSFVESAGLHGPGGARPQHQPCAAANTLQSLADPPLTDRVVRLRAWTPEDVPWIVQDCQDPEIPRWTFVPSPYGEQDGREFVALATRELASGETAKLAVVDARHGKRLGASGLVVIDWDRKAADVGYWVVACARRRGVASRALVLVARWAFDVLGLDRLELRPRRGNVASPPGWITPNSRPVISRPECDTLPDTVFYALRRDESADANPSLS